MIRSLFFAPANRADLAVKFHRFGADSNVLDLEDGTPDAEKAKARSDLPSTVAKVRESGLQGTLMVRVNVPSSQHYLEDLEVAFGCDIDGVILPKLESVEQAFPAVHWINQLEKSHPRPRARFLLAGLESIRGVLNAVELCTKVPHLTAAYFGAEDFAAETGARRTPEGQEVATARAMVLMAARATGVLAIDQAVVDIRDDQLFLEDARRGRDLGYQGKICVAPAQVKLAHEAFSPSRQEREYARRLVDAYEAATAKGVGTIDFEGRMIDGPLLKRAKAVLESPGGVS